MPTKPNLDFIPRDIREDKELSCILDTLSGIIEETVNFASIVTGWCMARAMEGNEYAILFLLYRHIFELLDAISILVRQSCIEPCKMFLRSIFEAFLSIEYILQKDTKQRAMDFFVCSQHQDLGILKRWDPKDPLYKKFDAIIKKDKILNGWERAEIPNIAENISSIERSLNEEPLLDAEKGYQEYMRANARHRPPRYWFNLHGGPRDLRELSQKLGREGSYEVLYLQWSRLVHSADITRGKLEVGESGRGEFSQLRNPDNCEFITVVATDFGIRTMILFVDTFAAEKKPELEVWYKTERMADYMSFFGQKRIIVKSHTENGP